MKKSQIKKYIVLLVVVCFIGLCFALYKLLLSESSDHDAIYGERLDGIEQVKFSSDRKSTVQNALSETSKIKSSTIKVQGNLLIKVWKMNNFLLLVIIILKKRAFLLHLIDRRNI